MKAIRVLQVLFFLTSVVYLTPNYKAWAQADVGMDILDALPAILGGEKSVNRPPPGPTAPAVTGSVVLSNTRIVPNGLDTRRIVGEVFNGTNYSVRVLEIFHTSRFQGRIEPNAFSTVYKNVIAPGERACFRVLPGLWAEPRASYVFDRISYVPVTSTPATLDFSDLTRVFQSNGDLEIEGRVTTSKTINSPEMIVTMFQSNGQVLDCKEYTLTASTLSTNVIYPFRVDTFEPASAVARYSLAID